MAHNRYPHLTWKQTRLGVWEREIDEAERFTHVSRSHMKAVGITESSLEDIEQKIEDAIRQAWLRLRFDHPTIASQVEYDHQSGKWKKTYTPFHAEATGSQIQEWLHETFVSVEPGMSGLEWCNADPPAPKVPTLFLITPVDTEEIRDAVTRRDLVIRSPHDIMDGIGTLQLLNILFTYAAEAFNDPSAWTPPAPGPEGSDLSPPLRVAAAILPILTLSQQECLQSIITDNAALRDKMQILTVPFKQGPSIPEKHQRVALELLSSETSKILDASKGLGATVTYVYHAAIAIALRDLQDPGPEMRLARYINYSLINERPRCTGDYATPKHAAAVYHSVSGNSLALDLMIPSIAEKNQIDEAHRQEEFHSLIEQVKSYYHAIRNSPDNLALAPAFWSMATPHISNPASTTPPLIPAPNLSPSVSISSMGVIDKIISPQHGAFKISNPWVAGEELGTGLGIFLGTWAGSLRLSAAYNDAWHDRDEVEHFLKHVQGVVWRGLGLDGAGE